MPQKGMGVQVPPRTQTACDLPNSSPHLNTLGATALTWAFSAAFCLPSSGAARGLAGFHQSRARASRSPLAVLARVGGPPGWLGNVAMRALALQLPTDFGSRQAWFIDGRAGCRPRRNVPGLRFDNTWI